MADINDLSEISGSALTKEQCYGILNEIDVTIRNLLVGDGKYGAMDIKEGAHESRPTVLLARLYDARRMYQEILDRFDTEENSIIITQWDNPDLQWPFGGGL